MKFDKSFLLSLVVSIMCCHVFAQSELMPPTNTVTKTSVTASPKMASMSVSPSMRVPMPLKTNIVLMVDRPEHRTGIVAAPTLGSVYGYYTNIWVTNVVNIPLDSSGKFFKAYVAERRDVLVWQLSTNPAVDHQVIYGELQPGTFSPVASIANTNTAVYVWTNPPAVMRYTAANVDTNGNYSGFSNVVTDTVTPQTMTIKAQ